MTTSTAIQTIRKTLLPNSSLVAVRVKGQRDAWVHNGLRFASPDEAAMYAEGLMKRWGDVLDYKVEPSDDAPNCTFPVPSDRYPVVRTPEEGGGG